MRRTHVPVPRVLLVATVVAFLLAALGACSDDPSGQRELNTVMVGADETLSKADSEAVSAIGLELVALGQPLEAWFAGTEPRAELLDDMTAAVDRIEARLTADRSSAVRQTFDPYVTAWRRILVALETDDLDEYTDAVERISELDGRRIDRVVAVYGEDGARDLLEAEGVDPSR